MVGVPRSNFQGNPINLAKLKPGYQRDGGFLAAVGGWSGGQHMRFYNNLPQKMEGIENIGTQTFTNRILGISAGGESIHQLYVYTKDKVFNIDQTGTYTDLTPASDWGITDEAKISSTNMFDESTADAVQVYCKHQYENTTHIFYHKEGAGTSTDLGVTVDKGGIIAIQPFLVIYDENGQVRWSNANAYTDFVLGDAGSDFITDKPLIWALPFRKIGALLWTDSEIWKMQFVGGSAIFAFEKVAEGFDVLDPTSIVQFGSRYYWCGTNCFYMFDGRLNIVPNTQNAKYFFDNVVHSNTDRPRVIGVPHYSFGEIWWGYETTTGNTYPDQVLIMDVKNYELSGQPIWWDTSLDFTAAAFALRPGPVDGNTIAFGVKDGSNHRVVFLEPAATNDRRSGSEVALPFNITTGPFSFPLLEGKDQWNYIKRLEPDWQTAPPGEYSIEILGREFANSSDSSLYLGGDTAGSDPKIDIEESARHLRVKLGNSVTAPLGDTFALGQYLVYMELSDSQ